MTRQIDKEHPSGEQLTKGSNGQVFALPCLSPLLTLKHDVTCGGKSVGMKKILLAIVVLIASSGASIANDWRYSESKDEMRDKTTYFAYLQQEDSKSKVKMQIRAFSEDNKQAYGFNFLIDGGEYDCPKKELCVGAIKVDGGEIEDLLFELSPKASGEAEPIGLYKFNNAITNSDTIFIEIPIKGVGVEQFKFKPSGLKWRSEE